MNQANMGKLTINKIRRSLVAGINLRAKQLRLTQDQVLVALLEKEFKREEETILAMRADETTRPL